MKPVDRWQLSGYADFCRFYFLKYRVSAPAKGWDYLSQAGFLPNKETEIYLRYRTENKPINEDGITPIEYPNQ
jgi:hypothetical protein